MLKKEKWKLQFTMIALGQAVSMLGSHGVQFALIWWLAEKTSSPLMLGISGLVAYLPMSLLSPLAGIMADRLNRKAISIVSDMGMGITAVLYAFLLSMFDLPVWTVFVMLCVRGIGSTFQQPAIQSIIPQLVPEDQLIKTNGWMQLLNAGAFLFGPVIGASLYAIFPMSVVLLSDVVGAVFASAALAVVKIPKLERKETKTSGMLEEFKEGVQIFREDNLPADDQRLFRLIRYVRQRGRACICRGDDGFIAVIFQRIKDKKKDQNILHRPVRHGNHVCCLRPGSACDDRMGRICAVLRGTGRVRKCTHDSADGLYSGNSSSGKNGTGVFCSDTDFIGDHAGGTVIQQSDRREGRRGPLVLHFGSGNRDHHDSYFVPVSHEIQKEKILIHCAAAFLLI